MSISGVCVDRGRFLVKEPTAARVEGSTQFVPVTSQWFKCRLFEDASPDIADAQGGHFESTNTPQVLTPAKDLDGVPLDIKASDRLEISSKQFGRFVWRMSGEPQPLRKKRKVIGWVLTVERVIEREYDDLLHQTVPIVQAPGL